MVSVAEAPTVEHGHGPGGRARGPGHERGRVRRQRLAALVRKEFLQLRRDRRTLGLIVGMPVVLLLVFGYAASFDVKHIRTELVGSDSVAVRRALAAGGAFAVSRDVAKSPAVARADLKHGRAVVAIAVDPFGRPRGALIDGSELLAASTALRELPRLAPAASGASLPVAVLYNPTLRSANYMVPGLIGLLLVQVGVMITSLGIVRERERGTLEQLMITPLSKLELMIGKIVPYLVIAFLDLTLILAVGLLVFSVPLRGSVPLLLALTTLFLASTLAIGLLVSTVAQNQQQAMQTAMFIIIPQILLSGFVFPLASIPWGVRWISYLMPLTYFLPIVRGIFLKGSGIGELWTEAAVLLGMAVLFVGLAASRFSKQLG
jgi:ABC transporter DrrB family efflux protein